MKRKDLVPLETIPLAPHEHWLETLEVRTTSQAVEADKAHLAVCALYDAADDRRKALKQPFLDGCQYYDAQWRAARKPLELVRDHLAKLLSDYEYQQRQAFQAQVEKKAAKLKDKERAQALVSLAGEKTPDLPYGKWLDEYHFEVQDWSQIPAEFLQLDIAKVKKSCKEGRTDIPGVKVTLRRKRSARA